MLVKEHKDLSHDEASGMKPPKFPPSEVNFQFLMNDLESQVILGLSTIGITFSEMFLSNGT